MPASGLVGWWKLLDGSGTTAADSSASSNNGTLQGSPTWVTDGPNGGGLSLDAGGSQDRVDVPRISAIEPSALTFCCWFKTVNPQDNANTAIIGKTWQNNNPPTYDSYQLGVNYGGVSDSIFFAAGGTTDVFVNGVVTDGTWTFVAGTYDPAAGSPQKVLYLNGSSIGSSTETSALIYDTTSTGDFLIGASGNPGGPGDAGYFKGEITDVRIYNRALTAAEILAIYNGTDSGIAFEEDAFPQFQPHPRDDIVSVWG